MTPKRKAYNMNEIQPATDEQIKRIEQLDQETKTDIARLAFGFTPVLIARIRDDAQRIQRITDALNEYQKYNNIHNDLEAYLNVVGEWALNGVENDKRPDPSNYGLAGES